MAAAVERWWAIGTDHGIRPGAFDRGGDGRPRPGSGPGRNEEDAVVDRIPRTYPQGVTCWIDLETSDAGAAARFSGPLLGRTLADAMPPAAPGTA